MTEPEPMTILIVDDHAIVRQGLRTLFAFQSDCQVVGEAESGEMAVYLAAELVSDIILMDLVMPGLDGVEATRRVKEVSPRSQVIVLTSFHEDVHIFPALHAGTLSYVLKDVDPDELVTTIRCARRGESVLHPQVAARVLQELRQSRPPSTSPFAQLSEREQDVLRLIADGRSNAEIAARLVISEKTVKGHVSNILSKLHLLDRTQAAVFAWQRGFMMKSEQKSTRLFVLGHVANLLSALLVAVLLTRALYPHIILLFVLLVVETILLLHAHLTATPSAARVL